MRTIFLYLCIILAVNTITSAKGNAIGTPNVLTIAEKAGVTTRDYPVQIGRPFVEGEIPNYPQAIINGSPVFTQADIKHRWPDGSAKHAILTFLIPRLIAGSTVTLTFQNQPSGNNKGYLKQAEMLSPEFNFDARMELTDSSGVMIFASARSILQSSSFTYWIEGAVATSIILVDHSAARAFDIGFDKYRSFRPIFHATFWPGVRKVRIRYIGEVSNTEALQDMSYSLVLKCGRVPQDVVYSKQMLTHHSATRWTKEFWIGGRPSGIQIDHNLEYLRKTKCVPHYDTTKVVSGSAIAAVFESWDNAAKDLFCSGSWVKAMGSTGGRAEIGPYPAWTTRWLYTGDKRMEEMALGNADLAAAWPMHFREGNDTKYFDRAKKIPGIGKVLSISTRPTIMLGVGNGHIDYSYTRPADKITPVGPFTNGGWSPDGAHQPDPFSPQYMLTGDFWYLEEMYFWASWGAAMSNGAATHYAYGRGPTGAEGGIPGEIRGQAWMLRNRVHAAFFAPDGSSEKEYLITLIHDAIAIWEGMRDIRGGPFEGNAGWIWGYSMIKDKFGGLGIPLLRHWERGAGSFVQEPLDPAIVKEAMSPWEQNFLIFALGRAKELGYPTGALLSWISQNLINQIVNQSYCPYLVAAYRLPTVQQGDSKYFDSWANIKEGFKSGLDPLADFNNNLNDSEHGYTYIALAATAMIAAEPGGAGAWEWMKKNVLTNAHLDENPKWALIPGPAPSISQPIGKSPLPKREGQKPPKVIKLRAS